MAAIQRDILETERTITFIQKRRYQILCARCVSNECIVLCTWNYIL